MSIKGAVSLIPSKIQGMLADYIDDLEEAWSNAGEEPLTISLSAKIGISKGKNVCEIALSFTKEKIKDSVSFEWNSNQQELFGYIKKIDNELKKEGASMTISTQGHEPVTLGKII